MMSFAAPSFWSSLAVTSIVTVAAAAVVDFAPKVPEIVRNLAETNFDITLDSASVALDANTQTSGNEINFLYIYDGPIPLTLVAGENADTTFVFQFMDFANCDTELSSPPLAFHDFVKDPGAVAGTFSQSISVDQALLDTSDVWVPGADTTSGSIQFCLKVNIYYFGEYVNFHETNLDAQVSLVEDSGFELTGVNVVRTGPVNSVANVSVEYPVEVTYCDDSAGDVAAPASISQGTPVQICVQLATPTAGVYVADIQTLSYTSPAQAGVTVSPINTNVASQTTELDCTQVAGKCRIKFIIRADYFVDPPQPVALTGGAILAFGTDTRRRLLIDIPAIRGLVDTAASGEVVSEFDSEIRNLETPIDDNDDASAAGIVGYGGRLAVSSVVIVGAAFVVI